jgi:hypothetical protein
MTKRDKIAWAVFAAHCVAIWIWAEVVHRKAPQATASAAVTADGTRFGKTEAERKKIFAELTRGEPQDRASVESRSDAAIWNRNRDSYFHEVERGRIPGVAARHGIPQWMGWWILDEGFHAHWPPAPGVTVLADDAPLAQKTRPLSQRRVIVSSPAEPAPAPAPAPGPIP